MVKTLPSKAEGASLTPGQEAKIPCAFQPKQNKTKQKNRNNIVTNSIKAFLKYKLKSREL